VLLCSYLLNSTCLRVFLHFISWRVSNTLNALLTALCVLRIGLPSGLYTIRPQYSTITELAKFFNRNNIIVSVCQKTGQKGTKYTESCPTNKQNVL